MKIVLDGRGQITGEKFLLSRAYLVTLLIGSKMGSHQRIEDRPAANDPYSRINVQTPNSASNYLSIE
jgi:hypothetical protein